MPRQLDEKKIKKLTKLLARPRSIDDLERLMGSPRRSIYRWLGSIEGVVRLGTQNRDVHYQIL